MKFQKNHPFIGVSLAEAERIELSPGISPGLFSRQVQQTNICLTSILAETKGIEPSPGFRPERFSKPPQQHHHLPSLQLSTIIFVIEKIYSCLNNIFYFQVRNFFNSKSAFNFFSIPHTL